MINPINNINLDESESYFATTATMRALLPLNKIEADFADKKQQLGKLNAEQLRSGFVGLAVLLQRHYAGEYVSNPDFPLRGLLSLRSNISLAFQNSDIHDIELGNHNARVWVNILTLAGVNGVMPLRLSEEILAHERRGGDSLHEFLDLLNRRFWELLFQSYRIGTRPQYGFHDHTAQNLIQGLAQNYVGLQLAPTSNQSIIPKGYQTYLFRHCFHSGRGTGGPSGLAELLSQAVAQPVTVSGWNTCKLAVPDRYQMRLGSLSTPSLQRGKCILGRRMQVQRSLLMSVAFHVSDWPEFCPTSGGRAIRALIGALNVCLADRVVVVATRYKVLVLSADTARLGQVDCQLGWGARLGGAGPHTSLIQVSRLAIANIKKVQ